MRIVDLKKDVYMFTTEKPEHGLPRCEDHIWDDKPERILQYVRGTKKITAVILISRDGKYHEVYSTIKARGRKIYIPEEPYERREVESC